MLQLITIWPFADEQVKQVCDKVKGVLVAEMNLGQVIREIQRINTRDIPIVGVNKVNSEAITPFEILDKLEGGGKIMMTYMDYLKTEKFPLFWCAGCVTAQFLVP